MDTGQTNRSSPKVTKDPGVRDGDPVESLVHLRFEGDICGV
jgi:hypothetical protein